MAESTCIQNIKIDKSNIKESNLNKFKPFLTFTGNSIIGVDPITKEVVELDKNGKIINYLDLFYTGR